MSGFAKAASSDNPTKARDHLISAGQRLCEVRLTVSQQRWPRWVNENIQQPLEAVQACLALVEKPGKEIYLETRMPLFLMHEPFRDHLKVVIADMRRIGNPEIMCVILDDGLYALEGVHRLTAASMQFLECGATLQCLAPNYVLTDDDWDRLQGDTDWVACAHWSGARTTGDIVEHVRKEFDGWQYRMGVHRRPGPGTYRSVIFGGPSAWSMRIKKADLTLRSSERMRMKQWNYDADANKYRISAGRFSATVFQLHEGWKIWIKEGYKQLPNGGFGTKLYTTAETAMTAAIEAVGELEKRTKS